MTARVVPATGERVIIPPRRKLSPKQRLEVLIAGKGKCEICLEKIIEAFDVDHRIPLALGGADESHNWRAVHPDCHRQDKTKADVAQIAKAKRQEKLRLDVPRTVSPSWSTRKPPKRPPLRVEAGRKR